MNLKRNGHGNEIKANINENRFREKFCGGLYLDKYYHHKFHFARRLVLVCIPLIFLEFIEVRNDDSEFIFMFKPREGEKVILFYTAENIHLTRRILFHEIQLRKIYELLYTLIKLGPVSFIYLVEVPQF